MGNNQFARDLFREYRQLTENKVETYNRLKTSFPLNNFPKHAAQVWQLATLAEAWGSIATALNGGQINYLKNWRDGQ